MKKILNLMIAFCCVLTCAFIFGGCNALHDKHTITNTEWIMNSTHHWHECDGCSERVDNAEHDWDRVVLAEETPTQSDIAYFVCKDCGMQIIDIFTVNEAEWNTALNLTTVDQFKEIAYVYTEGQTNVVTRDGDILSVGPLGKNADYWTKEENKYYSYIVVEEIWTKTEIEKAEYDEIVNSFNYSVVLAGAGVDYSTASYNKNTKAYECQTETYGKMELFFESGKLIKLTMANPQSAIELEYGDIQLELPNTTLVNEKVWNTALNLSTVDNLKITEKHQTGNKETIMYKDRNTVCYNSDPVEEVDGYYSKEDGKCYYYKEGNGFWAKTEIDKETYNSKTSFDLRTYNYYNFVYNEELQAYQYETLALYFESGKLVKIMSGEEIVCTIEYGDVNLELPNIHLVSETAFNTALNLSLLDNVRYTAQFEDETDGVHKTQTGAKNGNILHFALEEGGILKQETYYTIESGKYYLYSRVNSTTWTKVETEKSVYDDALKNLNLASNELNFAYNEESKAYEGVNDGDLHQIYFENGIFVNYLFTKSDGAIGSMIIEYDNINLELPTIS